MIKGADVSEVKITKVWFLAERYGDYVAVVNVEVPDGRETDTGIPVVKTRLAMLSSRSKLSYENMINTMIDSYYVKFISSFGPVVDAFCDVNLTDSSVAKFPTSHSNEGIISDDKSFLYMLREDIVSINDRVIVYNVGTLAEPETATWTIMTESDKPLVCIYGPRSTLCLYKLEMGWNIVYRDNCNDDKKD